MATAQRVTVKKTTKRKLFFEKCLFDWRVALDAEKDSKQRSVLWRALDSMRRYPLELVSGVEASRLVKGVGPNIASRLDHAWTVFERELGHEATVTNVTKLKRGECSRFDELCQKKLAAGNKDKNPVNKLVVTNGQPSTANVAKTGNRPKQVNCPTVKANADKTDAEDSVSMPITADINFEQKIYVPFEMDTFSIVFLVDNQEAGRKDVSVRDCLQRNAVPFEMCQLPLGDYAWLARCNLTGRELLLDCLVERKRWDDLASSIMDKRYQEQKMRLRRFAQCGGKVVWLIERQKQHKLHGRINDNHLCQAMANTRVQDGFIVHTTDDTAATAAYLGLLDQSLRRRYSGKALRSATVSQLQTDLANESSGRLLTLDQFRESFGKTHKMTVRDVFARQLAFCVTGLNSEKALRLTGTFPTMAVMARAADESRQLAGRRERLSRPSIQWIDRFFLQEEPYSLD